MQYLAVFIVPKTVAIFLSVFIFQDYTHADAGMTFHALKRLFCWTPYKYAPIPLPNMSMFSKYPTQLQSSSIFVFPRLHTPADAVMIFMLSRDYFAGCRTNIPRSPSQICVCFQNTQNSCNLHQSLVSQDTHSRRRRHISMLSRDYTGCRTNMPRPPSQISVGKICDETDAQAGALRRAWRRSADAPSRRGGPGGRALSPSVLEQRVAALGRKA